MENNPHVWSIFDSNEDLVHQKIVFNRIVRRKYIFFNASRRAKLNIVPSTLERFALTCRRAKLNIVPSASERFSLVRRRATEPY